MKRLVVALGAVVVVAGVGSWTSGPDAHGAGAAVSPFLPTPPFAPPRTTVFFGHAKSLTQAQGRWVLRVDPAAFLSGTTAQRAAVEDGAIGPGEPVPNDFYVRDEGHKLLTYRVAPTARITVITQGITAVRIPAAELAQILKGKNPAGRKLFGPQSGFWIRVTGDTVHAIDQQYTP